MSNVTDFISQYGALASNVSAQTGLTPAQILGQWGLETGWGTHFAGTNNLGNVSPGGQVANYATPEDAANAYIAALNHENINTNALGGDTLGFANALQAGGYAPAPYAQSVAGAINTAINNGASNTPDGLYDGAYHVTITGTSTTPEAGAQGSSGTTDTINRGTPRAGITDSNPVTKWIQSVIGNYTLIAIGIVLAIGALLISQRKTIIQVTKDVVK